jgi:predicted dehydrogenase
LLSHHPDLKAVSIAVPTAEHEQTARGLLQKKIACLVEKPLAPNASQARNMVELAGRCNALLHVGHTERFNPAVRALFSMAIKPRFMEVHRVSPMTFRSLDVGVVLDMMIHDLDIILALAGSELVAVDATGVAVLAEHEDIANARLIFANGCVANLTASRLAMKTERRLRIFSESSYVTLDYQNRKGVVIRKSDNAQALNDIRARLARGEDLSSLDYASLVRFEPLTIGQDNAQADPLTAELTDFLAAANQQRSQGVDGSAGCAAVYAAEQILQSIREHKWEGLEQPMGRLDTTQ